jgi:hypothetical protein
MFLSDFTECDIQFDKGIFTIDGERYINRGDIVVSIDLEERVVYFTERKARGWFDAATPFSEVQLIPLFNSKDRGY